METEQYPKDEYIIEKNQEIELKFLEQNEHETQHRKIYGIQRKCSKMEVTGINAYIKNQWYLK